MIFSCNSGGKLQKSQPSDCQDLELQTSLFGMMILSLFTQQLWYHLQEQSSIPIIKRLQSAVQAIAD